MKIILFFCYFIIAAPYAQVHSQDLLPKMKYIWKIDTLYNHRSQSDSFSNTDTINQFSIEHIYSKYVYYVDFNKLDEPSQFNANYKIEQIENFFIRHLDDYVFFDSSFVNIYKQNVDGVYQMLWRSEYGFNFDPFVLIDGVIADEHGEAGISKYSFFYINNGLELIDVSSNTEPLKFQTNGTYVCLSFGSRNSETLGQIIVFDLLGNQKKYDIINDNNLYELSNYPDIKIRDNNILVEINKKDSYADSYKLIIDLSKEKSAVIVRNETENENASIRILER